MEKNYQTIKQSIKQSNYQMHRGAVAMQYTPHHIPTLLPLACMFCVLCGSVYSQGARECSCIAHATYYYFVCAGVGMIGVCCWCKSVRMARPSVTDSCPLAHPWTTLVSHLYTEWCSVASSTPSLCLGQCELLSRDV